MAMIMVWPPPKVLATPEGEATVERPQAGTAEVSAVVEGVAHDPERSASEQAGSESSDPERSASEQSASDRSAETDRPPAPLGGGLASPFGSGALPSSLPGMPGMALSGAALSGSAMLPGATVSVMAATSVPRDWLIRPEALLGAVLGSRYRITSVIGRGPMGIACEGESSRGRQVTLKLLPRSPELPVEHFAWQVRQALALAHFDHPNVAPINDFGALEDGSAFVSRARVPGVTLRTVLRQGSLPLARALDIARQIAAALAVAHVQDIAHGRLKPENILLQGGARPGDLVKVIDFGMAGLPVNLRAVAPDENEALRLALRTRLYLPADVTGASPAIDVYSLGVLLFEMIAGQPPFTYEVPPAPGAQQAPRSFAECDPSLVVPGSVNELVFALMHPQAAEHGLGAERVGQLLDELLGRPGAAPQSEPVTSQISSARALGHGFDASHSTSRTSLADAERFDEPAAPELNWPASPAPAPERTHSFPPLPGGFNNSSFPPPARGPSSRPVPPTPPSARGSAGPPSYPTPPSARRATALVDQPFATQSFPPPSITLPPAEAVSELSLPASAQGASDDAELELRPSFIGRLKRLFGKKPPSEL